MAEVDPTAFTGELAPIRDFTLRLMGAESSVDDISGASCLGHIPAIAPLYYSARIFPGIEPSKIDTYEAIHKVAIPEVYRHLLHQMNGASIFGLTLAGVPPLMAQDPPQMDRSTGWPLDLGTAQLNARVDYCSNDFLIGYGPFSDDEHVGYYLWPNGKVEALRKGGAGYGEWEGIRNFLDAELSRAENLHSVQIQIKLQNRETGNQSALRRFLRKLSG